MNTSQNLGIRKMSEASRKLGNWEYSLEVKAVFSLYWRRECVSLGTVYIQQLAEPPNKTTKKDSGTKEAQNPQNAHQTVLEYKLQLLANINTVHQFEKCIILTQDINMEKW